MTISAKIANLITNAMQRTPLDIGYRLARRIVDRRHGDNNNDLHTNGELLVMRGIVPRAEVIFDVGANIGKWTELVLSINPRAQIHAFEPGTDAFARLSERKFPPTVHRNPVALGAQEEDRAYYVFGDSRGTNSLYQREGLTTRSVASADKVHVTTLDAYCRDRGVARIDFLKIDVEGHELAVLEGARGMLAAGNIDYVQFEYGGTYIDAGHLLRDVWTFLATSGARYDVYKILANGIRPIPEYRQIWETYQYSNWLLIRRALRGSVPIPLRPR
jgi:FkbM family methyltransferase